MSEIVFLSRRLRLEAEVRDLAQIRRFVQESAAAFRVAESDVLHIVLAVDEAVTNVILHGYGGKGGLVEIEVTRLPDALEILLRDEARPFDPTGAPARDLSVPFAERGPGGLGLHLIRTIMDQISYRLPPGGGNELTMIKRVSSPG
jgi:anti-sigma regulatory factor (Ser/Thr protein kinase)